MTDLARGIASSLEAPRKDTIDVNEAPDKYLGGDMKNG